MALSTVKCQALSTVARASRGRFTGPITLSMENRGLRSGHLLALGGAIAAIASLWAPWYELSITQAMRDAIQHQVDAFLSPAAAQYAHVGLSALPSSFHATAWQAFHQTDIAIAVLGGLAVLVIGAAGGLLGSGTNMDLRAAGNTCATLGLLVALTAGYRLLNPIGSRTAQDLGAINVAWGTYVCLSGGTAMLAGGLWGAMSGSTETTPGSVDLWAQPAMAEPTYAASELTGSVAPPRV